VSADITARVGAPLLEVRALAKTFHRGPELVHAVRATTFTIGAGEVVGLIGPSGSGKTTLLNVLSGWERPDEGTLLFRGKEIASPASLPWSAVTVVPQDLAMIEELSVFENVTLPLRLAAAGDDAYVAATALLEELGLGELSPRLPAEASLGEQQRAALARAIVGKPGLILADEPTGHQDEGWTKGVMSVIRDAAAAGAACLVATHNLEAMTYLDRLFSIRDGELAEAPVPR
jgi:ABC-type lipoprotein export system ATPase subunit